MENDLRNVEFLDYNSYNEWDRRDKGSFKYPVAVILKIKAKRLIKLNVSGPFHSSYMESASQALQKELNSGKYKINTPQTPIVFNYSAQTESDLELIKSNIINQVKGSVQWVKSVEFMVSEGVSTIVEIGPGKVLSGLNKKIGANLNVFNIENIENMASLLEDKICQKN